MAKSSYLLQIDRLKKEFDSFGKLSDEADRKLWKKLRLEWNYNSNHIEGNTLTYNETELLVIFDRIKGEKDMREYEEMKAHDVAIQLVIDEAKDMERQLTESFIRKLNEIILVRPFWKEAITAEGKDTKRLIEVGRYKQHPNSVQLSNGEIFHYTSPQDTPIEMSELMQWYSQNLHLHPLELAAELHYRFVRIHPFDDGNGRVSRLLMNYVLFRYNLPPVIIKAEDKKNYLTALNEADAGDIPAFTRYIAQQLIWTLQISIKAAKGETIDEPDDFDKRLNLIERQLADKLDVVEKTEDLMLKVYDTVIAPFIRANYSSVKKIAHLFESWELNEDYSNKNFKDLEDAIESLRSNIDVGYYEETNFVFELQRFKKSVDKFDMRLDVIFEYDDYEFKIRSEIYCDEDDSEENDVLSIDIGNWKYLEEVDMQGLTQKVNEISIQMLDVLEKRIGKEV